MDGANTWQTIRAEALRRMRDGLWTPGARIPNEADLAAEFGCARATVNRALRDLAQAGHLERKRKGGTRVPLTPVRKATFEIAIIRQDVVRRGQRHGYRLVSDSMCLPPGDIRRTLEWPDNAPLRRVTAVHLADETPFCLEDRWLNPLIAPPESTPFDRISANEWLVRNVRYSTGSVGFQASGADAAVAHWLSCAEGAALLTLERITATETAPITLVRLTYAPDHRVSAML